MDILAEHGQIQGYEQDKRAIENIYNTLFLYVFACMFSFFFDINIQGFKKCVHSL